MDHCIREKADIDQLRRCKKEIEEIELEIRGISKTLGLAGNEVRFKILYLLNKEEKMCPCDLSDVLEMSVPAVSQHLRKLKDGDLIESAKTGQTIFYSLKRDKALFLMPLLDLEHVYQG